LRWVYRFISGYLTVIFYGEFPEKILNLTSFNRIYLWNSRRTKKGIEANIFVKDFKDIRPILKNSGIKVHILKKHGLPFKIAKNRKRSGIIVGLIIFMSFLSFMSWHIWIIDVEGNKNVKAEEIKAVLSEMGISEGVKKSSINSKQKREELLLKIDSLAWASLNTEGCRLTVNVSEIKNKKPQKNTPSNLKAKADGIITKIDVSSGNCLVKKGDTVKAGDVLVSGIIERLGSTEFVKSKGVIIATTERSVTVKGDFKQVITGENGKTKTKRVLEIFSLKIPLFLGCESESYNETTKVCQSSLFGQKLPLRIYEKQFRFTEEYTVTYTRERLTEKLKKEIANKLKESKVVDYKIISQKIEETEKGITLTQIVASSENIVVNEELIVNQNKP